MAEIKISELSIGDWVATPSAEGYIIDLYTSEKAGCIARLVHDDVQMVSEWECIHLEPIPLTPEILEKNGFIDYEVGRGWYVLNVAGDLRVWLHRNSHDWTFQLMKWSRLSTHEICKVFIKHTHQLQHALRLAGVEKEIEL